MNALHILTTILITSLFCCGLTVASGKGMILHFLKAPFLNIERKIESMTLQLDSRNLNNLDEREVSNMEFALSFAKKLTYIFKPVILCCTCMGSFWGIFVFIILNGFNTSLIPYIIICCLGSCFLNAYTMAKYDTI